MKMITITMLSAALWACTDSSIDNPEQCQNPTSECSDNNGVRTDGQVDLIEDNDASVVEADAFVAEPENLGTTDGGETLDMVEGQTPTDAEDSGATDLDRFVKVSAGGYHSCALRESGVVVCWGRNNYGQSQVPSQRFKDISTNYWHSCGVTTTGNIQCWGDNEFGQSNGIEGDFAKVSAGYMHTCGLDTDGEVQCVGLEDSRIEPPAGPFIEIDSGWYHTCAVRLDQTAVCWGMDSDNQLGPIPDGLWRSVVAGGLHSCGVTQETDEIARVRCWGSNEFSQGSPSGLSDGTITNITAGVEHNCVVFSDGLTECWGQNNRGQADADPAAMRQVSAGLDHTCALSLDGDVLCWGRNNHGQADFSETPAQ